MKQFAFQSETVDQKSDRYVHSSTEADNSCLLHLQPCCKYILYFMLYFNWSTTIQPHMTKAKHDCKWCKVNLHLFLGKRLYNAFPILTSVKLKLNSTIQKTRVHLRSFCSRLRLCHSLPIVSTIMIRRCRSDLTAHSRLDCFQYIIQEWYNSVSIFWKRM